MTQENGARTNRVSILTETTNSQFSHICSSVIPDSSGTKFTEKVPFTRGGHIPNLNILKVSGEGRACIPVGLEA